MKKEFLEEESVSNKICNHFFQNCEAKICINDYNFVEAQIQKVYAKGRGDEFIALDKEKN